MSVVRWIILGLLGSLFLASPAWTPSPSPLQHDQAGVRTVNPPMTLDDDCCLVGADCCVPRPK